MQEVMAMSVNRLTLRRKGDCVVLNSQFNLKLTPNKTWFES
jgi:hypothetical protein